MRFLAMTSQRLTVCEDIYVGKTSLRDSASTAGPLLTADLNQSTLVVVCVTSTLTQSTWWFIQQLFGEKHGKARALWPTQYNVHKSGSPLLRNLQFCPTKSQSSH